MRNKPKLSTVFLNGIITENPTFRLVLGICPTIAVTSGLINAIGMALPQLSFWWVPTLLSPCSGTLFLTRFVSLAL